MCVCARAIAQSTRLEPTRAINSLGKIDSHEKITQIRTNRNSKPRAVHGKSCRIISSQGPPTVKHGIQ